MAKALYPGTFDPITLGHIDIIERALHLFDEVTIAIATSESKKPVFTLEERISHVEQIFKGNKKVKAIGFTGLVVDLAKEENSNILIRGLRAVSDFEYEFQLANMNRAMSPDLESVFSTRYNFPGGENFEVPQFGKQFNWDRNYNFKYDITKNLKFDLY